MTLPDARRPTPAWARRVLRLWGRAPAGTVLIGNDAEKVHVARRILGV